MHTQTQDRLEKEEQANAEVLRKMLENFELEENEMLVPAYPMHRRGERRDGFSFLPVDADRVELAGFVLPVRYVYRAPPLRMMDGILEDILHPASEPITSCAPSRTNVYKARPLPLRCESCDVECDSYISFTNHCLLFEHKVNVSLYTAPKPANDHRRRNSDLLGRVVQRVVC